MIKTFLSCDEIYNQMVRLGYSPIESKKYAYEFQLSNGHYVYVKRLKDSKASKKWASRLMIHPGLKDHRSLLEATENVSLRFAIEENMSTAFVKFPVSPLSKSAKAPSRYGAGVNFKTPQAIEEFISRLSKI